MIDDQFYTNLNKFLKNENIPFLNHGYSPSYNFIKDEHMDFKNQLSLYLSLFDDITLEKFPCSILDIGCGRGGGIGQLNEYYNFNYSAACDLNKENIKFAKKMYSSNTKFKKSSAENLKYRNHSFDIITNVESSHSYKNLNLFFKEVKRVLKKDGVFLYTDTGNNIYNFDKYSNIFKYVIKKDITENIINSCKDDIEHFKNLKIKKEKKDYLIGLAKSKYFEYSSGYSKYMFYQCTDNPDWFKK